MFKRFSDIVLLSLAFVIFVFAIAYASILIPLAVVSIAAVVAVLWFLAFLIDSATSLGRRIKSIFARDR